MFWINEPQIELSLEEKVEFLYKKAKKDEKRQARKIYYKISFFLLFIGYTYYAYIIFIPMMKEYVNVFLGGTSWLGVNGQNMENIIKKFVQPQQIWDNTPLQIGETTSLSGISQEEKEALLKKLLK